MIYFHLTCMFFVLLLTVNLVVEFAKEKYPNKTSTGMKQFLYLIFAGCNAVTIGNLIKYLMGI